MLDLEYLRAENYILDIRGLETISDPEVKKDMELIRRSMIFAFDQIEFKYASREYAYRPEDQKAMLKFLYGVESIDDLFAQKSFTAPAEYIKFLEDVEHECYETHKFLSTHFGRCQQAANYSIYYINKHHPKNFFSYLMSSKNDSALRYYTEHSLAVFQSISSGIWYACSCANFANRNFESVFTNAPMYLNTISQGKKHYNSFQRGTSVVYAYDYLTLKSLVQNVEGGHNWSLEDPETNDKIELLYPIQSIPEDWYNLTSI